MYICVWINEYHQIAKMLTAKGMKEVDGGWTGDEDDDDVDGDDMMMIVTMMMMTN